jgi:hypothetical protein
MADDDRADVEDQAERAADAVQNTYVHRAHTPLADQGSTHRPHSGRSANVYLVNLVVTTRAELHALPEPEGEDGALLWTSFDRFLDVAHTIAPHLAFRLLQTMRAIIASLQTAEAPAGTEPP